VNHKLLKSLNSIFGRALSAVKLYERLGFKPYAIDERALKLSDGAYVDEMLMRLRVTR
jgi:RimJ/RimL family protein N-acetyltransferase